MSILMSVRIGQSILIKLIISVFVHILSIRTDQGAHQWLSGQQDILIFLFQCKQLEQDDLIACIDAIISLGINSGFFLI